MGSQPQPQPDPPVRAAHETDWRAMESSLLGDHVRLTSPEDFAAAGEAYFSPDANWIIFQAKPVPPEGEPVSPHYSMYVARLIRDGQGTVSGLEAPVLISPPGSANTCGWFHPEYPGKVIFGSTVTPPVSQDKPGFRVGQRRYVWAFPEEMNVVQRWVPEILARDSVTGGSPIADLQPVFDRPGYDAECSYSANGRTILYANVDPSRPGKPDADIWVRDVYTGEDIPLVQAEGYDGGPFFSPDEKWICYRSDRLGDDRLQLFIAELEYDADGRPAGVRREIQLTDNGQVNWAPFYHPSGSFIVFASSLAGHDNYEVFAIETTPDKEARRRVVRRVTWAEGFDGLPVFSPDGSLMMWTSQRSDAGKGTSQLWIAGVRAPAADWPERMPAGQAEALALGFIQDLGWDPSTVNTNAIPYGRGGWYVELSGPGGNRKAVVVDLYGNVVEQARRRGV